MEDIALEDAEVETEAASPTHTHTPSVVGAVTALFALLCCGLPGLTVALFGHSPDSADAV